MSKSAESVIRSCVALLMRPVVQFCISRGVRFQDFSEIAKRIYVREAEALLRDGEHVAISVSRICAMTGIQRPEISRLQDKPLDVPQRDFMAKIIGQWLADKRFIDKRGKPKPLSTSGARSDFRKLVFSVSKSLNPHTVLFELSRLNLITVRDGSAILANEAYLTTGDPSESLRMVAHDAADLLVAGQENAFLTQPVANLHAKTEYDNIPDEDIPEIREWILALGQRFHEEIRRYLAKRDRDINPSRESGNGKNRVLIGSFSRIERLHKR